MNAHARIAAPADENSLIGLGDDMLEGAAAIAKALGPRWTARRVYKLVEEIAAGASDAPVRKDGKLLISSKILLNRWRLRQLDPDNKLT